MAHTTITTEEAYLPSTFETWSQSTWLFDGDNFPSLIAITPSPPQLSRPDTNIPSVINFYQATRKETFQPDWDMERVWIVKPDSMMPRLITRGSEGDLGQPREHSKHYILVEPDLDGTMNWDGVTWKYITTFLRNPFPSLVGNPGDRVTYAVPLNELNQVIYDPKQDKYVPVRFIASAIRDPFGAGGFSSYTSDTVRSDIINNSFSTIINFYFARLSDLPRVNYKLKIQTPTELVECNTRFGNEGPIVASTNPDSNELITIPYVNLLDPMATNIHVNTPDGVKALMKWQNEKNYNLGGN